jgi:hypothetical protein
MDRGAYIRCLRLDYGGLDRWWRGLRQVPHALEALALGRRHCALEVDSAEFDEHNVLPMIMGG